MKAKLTITRKGMRAYLIARGDRVTLATVEVAAIEHDGDRDLIRSPNCGRRRIAVPAAELIWSIPLLGEEGREYPVEKWEAIEV